MKKIRRLFLIIKLDWWYTKLDIFVAWLAVREAVRSSYPFHLLGLLRFIGLDHWYAIKVLGWEFDCYANPRDPDDYHYHTPFGTIIRPRDYSFTRIRSFKRKTPRLG